MHHESRLAMFAVYFALSALSSPAFGRPPCHPPSESSDVTAAIPCRRLHSDLLEFLADADIPPSVGFIAKQHFVQDRPPRELQITWIGSNFRHHFLSDVEPQQAGRILDVYQLRDPSNDQAILESIGMDPETNLHDVWALLSKQSHGETGPLRTDGVPNVFYVRDGMGKTWAVDSVWSGAGWEMGASRLNSVMRQRGTHVFAR